MQVNKSIKIFLNLFLGPALFLLLSWSILLEVRAQPGLEASWARILQALQSPRAGLLFLALLLVPVNWGLEARKWRIALEGLVPLSRRQALRGILSGVSFGLGTPNRIGEYAGRALHLPEGARLRTVSATLAGNLAQLLVTLAAGTAGLTALRAPLTAAFPFLEPLYPALPAGFGLLTAAAAFFYFRAGKAGKFLVRRLSGGRLAEVAESLGNFNVQLLGRILLLSFIRYLVFIIQYGLLFYLFEVEAGLAAIGWVVSVLFLALALIPTVALAEAGLRGQLSLKLMGLFSVNSLGIGLAALTVWLINLIVPAAIGSLLVLNVKVFRAKHESA